jgi:hypothetical protein
MQPSRTCRSRRLIAAVTLCTWLVACSHVAPYAVPSASIPAPDLDAVDHRVLLIGDTGAPDPDGEPALQTLEARVAAAPDRTTVVFLGDVVYETGMPQPSAIEGTPVEEILDQALLNMYESRQEAERRVKDQLKAVDFPGATAVVIPGNHDWDQFGVGGWKSVRELGAYLHQAQGLIKAKMDFLPGGGCPGPVSVDTGTRGRVIVLDTQWWLEVGAKPGPAENPTSCPNTTEEAVAAALVRELRAAHDAGRVAIVVGHHPLRSKGPHGGYVDPLVHLFPMLMLGSYVPFFVAGSRCRSRHPRCQHPQLALAQPSGRLGSGNRHAPRALGGHGGGCCERRCTTGLRAGHDHACDVPRRSRRALLPGQRIGLKVKASEVATRCHAVRACGSGPSGFMQLDLLRDGRARLAVVEWAPDVPAGREVYSMVLERDSGTRAHR